MAFERILAIGAMAALLLASPAEAQKSGGVLKIYFFDSPATMSIHEESTIAGQGPMMGVFNNLVMYDPNVPQSGLKSVVPDLATIRDRARSPRKQKIYAVLALGWRGSAVHWQRQQSAYLLLAGLATPLVLSVHSVVSFDFSIAIVPGWHSTIFPPYFVAGALFSGFAMVLTLAIPLRYFYGLEDFITLRHLQNMAKILLATGLIVSYGYLMEYFTAWYSGERPEWYQLTVGRPFGPGHVVFWLMILGNPWRTVWRPIEDFYDRVHICHELTV